MNSQELRALQEAYSQVYELEEGDNYDKNRKRAAQRAAARNEARAKGQTGNVPGVGYVTPRKERETYTDAAGTERHKSGARMPQKEEVDLYDIILSHLLDEGYADTQEQAEAIMVNMSEDWRESIVEEVLDEGQKKYPTEKVENAGNRKVRTLSDPNISPEKRLKTTKQLNTITTSFMSHLTNRPQPVPPKKRK